VVAPISTIRAVVVKDDAERICIAKCHCFVQVENLTSTMVWEKLLLTRGPLTYMLPNVDKHGAGFRQVPDLVPTPAVRVIIMKDDAEGIRIAECHCISQKFFSVTN